MAGKTAGKMAGKATEIGVSVQDRTKLALAAAALAVGVGLFYYLDEQGLFVKVIAILAMTAVAIVIFFTTAKGHEVADFLKGSRIELQKMVWPGKSETLHSTLLVFAVVFIIALFLWLLDLSLAWFMQLLIK